MRRRVPLGAGTIYDVASKFVVPTSVTPRGLMASALGVLALMLGCAAAVAGWRAAGIASTAKHFPVGGATANTDRTPVTIRRTRALARGDRLPPFRAAIRAGVPLVMVGHARYPALDPTRIASQSRPIIEGVLRGELGFRGVVITDSMEARASLATGGITAVSERAVRAGSDLVLLTGRGSYEPVFEHLLAVARRSPAFRVRIRQAAGRVLLLKDAARSSSRRADVDWLTRDATSRGRRRILVFVSANVTWSEQVCLAGFRISVVVAFSVTGGMREAPRIRRRPLAEQRNRFTFDNAMPPGGLEPPTHGLGSHCYSG